MAPAPDEQGSPLVSVVIPSYNAEKWITETIESILMQDYPNLELILVDDCSTDSTFAIARSLCMDTLAGQVIQKNPQNMGECRTSNRGFDLARGKYITRISSDDKYVDPHHISNQVETLEQSGADWCYNAVTATGSDMEHAMIERGYWLPVPLKYAREPMKYFDNLILRVPWLAFRIWLKRNPVNSSSLMIRADSYRKIAGDIAFRTTWDTVILGTDVQGRFPGNCH